MLDADKEGAEGDGMDVGPNLETHGNSWNLEIHRALPLTNSFHSLVHNLRFMKL